ncbi:hypothetical protein FRB94_009014 [Tulasnella sp. JGI-2019a]|nr:hypothetical protein FRB93_003457 [Tulasnella sp. JGI-2019a]KAG9014856.1 hypothetical protein FRB94_009014 [Tulasnella sp. JGI-2019a]KAG9039983.1 hypothetical protein FRB95_004455 [Tulasnella sp. JGI-2019a]
MPGAQFFAAAFAFAAAACSVVHASPAHLKRQLAPVRTLGTIACTGWAGHDKDHSGIRVWTIRDGVLQEDTSINGGLGNNDGSKIAPNSGFFRPKNGEYTIANNAAISAASAYNWENRTVEVQMFFVSTDNILRSYYFDGTTWGEGTIKVVMPQFAQRLSANAFRINGVTTWSVIYAEGNGETTTLKEFRSVGPNAWRWAGNIGTTPRDTAFAALVSVSGNTVNEVVIAANNVKYRTNWQ